MIVRAAVGGIVQLVMVNRVVVNPGFMLRMAGVHNRRLVLMHVLGLRDRLNLGRLRRSMIGALHGNSKRTPDGEQQGEQQQEPDANGFHSG